MIDRSERGLRLGACLMAGLAGFLLLVSCSSSGIPHPEAKSRLVDEDEYMEMLGPVAESLRDIRIPRIEFHRMPLSEAVHKLNDLAQKNSRGKFSPRIYLNLSNLKPARAREIAGWPVTLSLRNVELGRAIAFLCNNVACLYFYEPGAVVIQPDEGMLKEGSRRPAWKP